MQLNKNQQAFFELLRAGLWSDGNPDMRIDETTDWQEVYKLASEQSVLGLVLAGLEHSDMKPPQMLLLQWIGEVQIIEQRNKEMNVFIADLIEILRKNDIYTLLVKGQGIAQCYEKPLWRSSGDVDLLLSDSNYEKAKKVLIPLASNVENEFQAFKHVGMTINGWAVELHGTLHTRLSERVDSAIDEIQNDVFYGGNVRSAEFKNSNSSTIHVFLPRVDEDVIFVFTHILHHFFIDGIGLRQICDWCRLLLTYREKLNMSLLEERLREAGLMSEWKAFAALAIEYLGMPVEAMPFLKFRDEGLEFIDRLKDKEYRKYKSKADRILEYILEVGNFGHNQKRKHSKIYVLKKIYGLWRKFKNFCHHFDVFPIDSIKFFCSFVISGLDAASRRE